MADPGNTRYEGQLSKFTNVVKGWQYRWFVLEPESGRLEYHLLEDRNGRCRGSQQLTGAVVVPSEEDGQTFSVNFASGEVFKVRASHTKERQVWVDRLRACAHRHNLVDQITRGSQARQEGSRDRPHTPPGARSHISTGQPSEQLQTLSLSALDAFGSVHDMLHKVEEKHRLLAQTIEALPAGIPGKEEAGNMDSHLIRPRCHDSRLLVLKATSQSTLLCMEAALGMLQEIREGQLDGPVVVRQSLPRPKTLSETSSSLLPHSPSRHPSTSTPRASTSSRPSSISQPPAASISSSRPASVSTSRPSSAASTPRPRSAMSST